MVKVKAIAILEDGDFHQQIKFIFSIYDLNNDGLIEKKEIKKLIESYYDVVGLAKKYRASRHKAKEFIRNFDLNEDRKVDRTEFVEGFYLYNNYSTHIYKHLRYFSENLHSNCFV